jgi:hypothetical protein
MNAKRTAIAVATIVVIGGCQKPDVESTTSTTGAIVTPAWQSVSKEWPESSRSAVKEMVDAYGAPDEVTPTQMLWGRRGPWKRSVVSKEEVPHDWPSPHVDVLEQFIDYRVPPDKADDLAAFDGSVMIERTKGELSARCGGEAANFLALNLAREVAEGNRTVADARHFYEESMKAKKSGQKNEYLTGLRFTPPQGGTADKDKPAP